MKRDAWMITWGITLLLMLVAALPAMAQDNVVTSDMVNDIAEHMYCPICENEPLDDCRNPTCIQWKQEIGTQLAQGRTEEQIISYFVERYGQQVVGVPQDPLLRAFSLAAPVVGTALALIFAGFTFLQWQKQQKPKPAPHAGRAPSAATDDYRKRLEEDLL